MCTHVGSAVLDTSASRAALHAEASLRGDPTETRRTSA